MRKYIMLVALVAALVVTSVAVGGPSTVLGAYGSNSAKPVIKVDAAVTKTSTSAAKPATTATLPFTGSDLGLITVAGVGLLGLGIGLRKVGRSKS
jgi:hypothetical protein